MSDTVSAQILQEQITYYKNRAGEYDEWFYRRGRFDRGPEDNARWFAEVDEVFAALDAFQTTGDVLELAPGTGIWTERLVRTAASITAVDASPEMIDINRARVSSELVTYKQADLFTWQPERTYDAVIFCFWISHVPLELLDGFLARVSQMLKPGGKLFFIDGRREPTSTALNHILPAEDSQTMTRKLNDGQAFTIVKNFHDPIELAARCTHAGLNVHVQETATYFLFGMGTK
jgi:demethylmenaquinone methyltransferase/2-methoxy-6-polyprenyl-1,4-benzoquinol methylase